jgi:hypothetical protein
MQGKKSENTELKPENTEGTKEREADYLSSDYLVASADPNL